MRISTFPDLFCALFRTGIRIISRAETQRLLPSHSICRVGFVSAYDALNQRVPHNVSVVKVNKCDAFDSTYDLLCFNEPGHLARRQVDLCDVTGDDYLCVVADL